VTSVLLVYYSQTGEVQRIAESIAGCLNLPDVEVTTEILRPIITYPYPWKSIRRFFNVLPECHWGPLPPLEPLRFDRGRPFDLVILVYQVWFLAPSLPVQSFLHTEGQVLRNVNVVTFSVSRNMWHSASETMKRLLRDAGARHVDNVVLTFQGPAWLTFVTTPHALLFGKKEGRFGVIPAAGLGVGEVDRARRLARILMSRREELKRPDSRSFLRGEEAVRIDRRFILAERAGWYCFRWWGRLILRLQRWGPWCRQFGVYLFVAFLVVGIIVGIPATLLIRLLLRPIVGPWMARYARTLQQPSEP
jgi:hypothetical protein